MVIQKFLEIKFWFRLKPLKQLCGVVVRKVQRNPTGRKWGCTGRSYKQGH